MTQRYTISQLVMESQSTLRNDGIRRRTSGSKYWLATLVMWPLFGVLIYWGAAWLSYLGFSGAVEKVRALRASKKS